MSGGLLLTLAELAVLLVVAYWPVRRLLHGALPRLARGAGRPGGAWVEPLAELLTHALVLAAAVLLLGLPPAAGPAVRELALVPLGVLAGVGEAAVAAFAGSLLADAADRARLRPAGRSAPVGGPAVAAHWLSLTRSPWVWRRRRLLESWPLPLAPAFLLAWLAGEEAVFRGVLLTALRPAPLAVAVGAATAVYLAAQLWRPSARSDPLHPLVACSVLGLTNGLLYWRVPSLAPLVAANSAFYLFAAA